MNAPCRCSELDCDRLAVYTYRWQGKPAAFACEKHAELLKKLAEAMNLVVLLEPIRREARA